MEYHPNNIETHFKKVDSKTIEISNIPLKIQGSTLTMDFDNFDTYSGPFVVKCFLASEFLIYFNDSGHLINPWDGFSHLLFHEKSDPRLNDISFVYRYPDDDAEEHRATIKLQSTEGLLRCIIMTIPEKNVDAALDIAHKTFIGILDAVCLRKQIPIQIQRLEVLTDTGGRLRSIVILPYSAVEFTSEDIIAISNLPKIVHPCLALYREAINSCNPYYRLLCLYRISERLREIQSENTKKLKRDSSFKRRSLVIPDNDLTNTFFNKYIGKSLNHFLENHVRPEYRNNISHLGFGKGSFNANGNMKLPAADNMVDSSVGATNAVLIEAINEAIREEIKIIKKYNLE
jgi:hypothetical protein